MTWKVILLEHIYITNDFISNKYSNIVANTPKMPFAVELPLDNSNYSQNQHKCLLVLMI